MSQVQTAVLGRSPVFRIGRLPDPLAPPDWRYAELDGTLGGRFDDPRGRQGLPPQERYRVLYVAAHPAAAFAEAIARFHPSIATLACIGVNNPSRPPGRGIIPRDWRQSRRLGATVLFAGLPLADVEHPETVQALRPVLAPLATQRGIDDVDLSAVTGPERELTQEAALHLYLQHDHDGRPLYAGLRYVSHLHAGWECWAMFVDRVRRRRLTVDLIVAEDPHLYEAARLLNLAIEDDQGSLIVPS